MQDWFDVQSATYGCYYISVEINGYDTYRISLSYYHEDGNLVDYPTDTTTTSNKAYAKRTYKKFKEYAEDDRYGWNYNNAPTWEYTKNTVLPSVSKYYFPESRGNNMIKIKLTESEYYPDDYFMYDTFDTEKEGEYWYRTNHGVGLGSVPKGIYIYKTVEAPYGVTYFLTPNIISAKALKDYDIKEETPPDDFLAKYDTGNDNRKYKDDFKTWIKGAKALTRESKKVTESVDSSYEDEFYEMQNDVAEDYRKAGFDATWGDYDLSVWYENFGITGKSNPDEAVVYVELSSIDEEGRYGSKADMISAKEFMNMSFDDFEKFIGQLNYYGTFEYDD